MHDNAPTDDRTMRPDRLWSAGRIAVLGLGNVLLSDEGVGVHTIDRLRKQYSFTPSVNLVDGGTMGLDLLPLFQTAEKILIIDAVDFGMQPGHVGILEREQIPSALNPKLSVHHISLSDILFTAELMREDLPDVRLIGVQPKSLSVGFEMTDEIRSRMDEIVDLTVRKLGEWDVRSIRSSST